MNLGESDRIWPQLGKSRLTLTLHGPPIPKARYRVMRGGQGTSRSKLVVSTGALSGA